MPRGRPTRECAGLLLNALQKLGPTGRQRLYEHTGLTTNEMQRGLRCLQDAEAVSNKAPDQWHGCYALTGREFPPGPGVARAKSGPPPEPEVSFDGLLSAWNIRPPERPTHEAGKRVVAGWRKIPLQPAEHQPVRE